MIDLNVLCQDIQHSHENSLNILFYHGYFFITFLWQFPLWSYSVCKWQFLLLTAFSTVTRSASVFNAWQHLTQIHVALKDSMCHFPFSQFKSITAIRLKPKFKFVTLNSTIKACNNTIYILFIDGFQKNPLINNTLICRKQYVINPKA